MQGGRERASGVVRKRAYVALLSLLTVVAHLAIHLEVTDGVVGWIGRASEGWMLALFLAVFVVLVVDADADTGSGRFGRRRIVWYGALLVLLAVLEGPLVEMVTGQRLPQAIVSGRETWAALLLTSGYLDWSRRLVPLTRSDRRRTRPATHRAAWYAAMAAASIAVYVGPLRRIVGPELFTTLDLHAEVLSAAILLAAVADLVVPAVGGDDLYRPPPGTLARPVVVLVWCVAAATALLLAQGPAQELFGGDLGTWWVRSAEAPLAALIVTAWALLVRAARDDSGSVARGRGASVAA